MALVSLLSFHHSIRRQYRSPSMVCLWNCIEFPIDFPSIRSILDSNWLICDFFLSCAPRARCLSDNLANIQCFLAKPSQAHHTSLARPSFSPLYRRSNFRLLWSRTWIYGEERDERDMTRRTQFRTIPCRDFSPSWVWRLKEINNSSPAETTTNHSIFILDFHRSGLSLNHLFECFCSLLWFAFYDSTLLDITVLCLTKRLRKIFNSLKNIWERDIRSRRNHFLPAYALSILLQWIKRGV